jgi:hypothetical protein
LLSRKHPAEAASEIEPFHVDDQPGIVRAGRASGEKTPEIRALGFVRSHRCAGCLTLQTPRRPSDEAVVRFACQSREADPATPFWG